MKTVRIIIITEDKEYFEVIKDNLDIYLEREFDIIEIFPLPELEEMVLEILKWNPFAIIVDSKLNDNKIDIKYNIPYSNLELIGKIIDENKM